MSGRGAAAPGAHAPRAVVADDDATVVTAVRAVLGTAGIEVVGTASDADGAVARALQTRPDVAILDIRMPGGGIRAAEEILRTLPGTTVIMLTASDDDEDLFDALSVGASGYLRKGAGLAGVPAEVRRVTQGEVALPRALVAKVVEEFRARSGSRRVALLAGGKPVRLTEREWQVLDCMRTRLSTRKIAERLFVSPATVRSHIAAIVQKLEVPDRESAIRAVTEG